MRLQHTTSRKVRGFTLIELMVVVVIIAVLAVIAVPLFSSRMQGRRLFQLSASYADLYRGSRARALGRGAATMVTLDQDAHTLTVFEAVEGDTFAAQSGALRTACGAIAARGCMLNNWGNVGSGSTIGTARVVDTIGPGAISTNYTIGDSTTSVSGGKFHVCFTPGGRAYYNDTSTWTPTNWKPLQSSITLSLSSTSTAASTPRHYAVTLLPNGVARLSP